MLVAFYVTLMVWFLPIISKDEKELTDYPSWSQLAALQIDDDVKKLV